MSIGNCTAGKWQKIFLDKVCIGVGVELEPGYNMMVCNSMLPDSDAEYKKEKRNIESDMALIAASKEMYSLIINMREFLKMNNLTQTVLFKQINETIPKI